MLWVCLRMSAGWARVSARPLSCMRPSAAEESLVRHSATGVLRKGNGLCASVSWKMCFPASNIRLFLWRRDGQDRAERFPAEYSHEKWRKETSTLSPPTHTHTHSQQSLSRSQQSPCMMWWKCNQGLHPPHVQAEWETIGVWKWATDISPHTPQPPINGNNIVLRT